MKKIIHALMICFCTLQIGMLQAREFSGIALPEAVLLEGVTQNININGVGMRTKFFFDIYIGALYLEKSAKTSNQVLSQNGPNRVLMHFLYEEVSSEKLVAGWNEGFENNLTEKDLAGLAERITIFNGMFENVHQGDVVLLDYLPGQGTRVTIKGVAKGVIAGEDFNHALLNIWLGDEPADDDLKAAMLGTED